MKKILILILLICTVSMSQTSLSAGDIAIVGLNCDDPDDFAFVLLRDISTNTVINFTDNGWFAAGGFRSGEGVIAYTAPSNQTAGTVIIYTVNSTNFSNVSGSFLLSTSGDQIIAFQGTFASPTLIYALNDDGAGVWQTDATNSNTSALPTGLVNGTSAVALNEVDNAYYSGGSNSDLNLLRTQIGNNANWTGDDTTPYNFTSVIPNPLPVELSSFSAIVLENSVKLNWRTETEVSNYGFEIERTAPLNPPQGGTSGEWNTIGFVIGHGNSNSPKDYSFIDNSAGYGKYSYRLKQIDTDGQFEYSKVIEVDLGSPTKFELSQNYPNPFNPVTTIKFSVPQSGNVKLTVYNLLGEQIAEPVNGFKEAGIHTINFSAKGGSAFGGNAYALPSGLYIYKLEANGFVQSRKMTLIK